ncbi:DUF5969 family protein [Polymorphum gilvum]|uniref:Uncharacterized protein n=1 Tax=Polymorphum gilvum (strain LMG 25793 / CGMCC 1.9160 / SL003B-26A1) TaxID=991905 RepID=F2IY42_POLGS|nr:DUF5969 family protein [Polymorphum gilvum]ADZ70545.1 hypothetical protein SL003B_2120 [Polymorphum gilvum SL003B-26A1]
MADEEELWIAIRSINDKIKNDAKFAEAFDKSPARALRGSNLDVMVPATPNSRSSRLSTLLGRMTDIERRATIDAVVGSRLEGPGNVALATPVANANVGANANAVANANANANANTNTNGFAAVDIAGDLVRVSLDQSFARSDLAKRLGALQLTEARQQALIKSVFADGSSVVDKKASALGEVQKAVGSFRGVSFEVEALVSGADIHVTGGRVLK